MNQLTDKVVLLGCGVLVAVSSGSSDASVIVWLLSAASISALHGAFGNRRMILLLFPAYLVTGCFSVDSVYGAR